MSQANFIQKPSLSWVGLMFIYHTLAPSSLERNSRHSRGPWDPLKGVFGFPLEGKQIGFVFQIFHLYILI